MDKPAQIKDGKSLELLLRKVVDSCIEFNEAVYYQRGQPGTESGDAANERLADLYRQNVGLLNLDEIKKLVAEIAPPIKQEDRERLERSPIKSQDAGDSIKEDKLYWVASAGLAYLGAIKASNNFGNHLLARDSFRVHLNEIMALPVNPRDNQKEWGRVLTEVIWQKRVEPILHVYAPDLQPGGAIYVLIFTDAETACAKRKLKRIATFQTKCGMDCAAFLALDDAARIRVIETCSETPEEKDKAAVLASRLLADARAIEAISVSDGELKEALRDRLVERLGRMIR